MGPWIAVSLGGAIGAMLRFGIGTFLLPVIPGRFPWATLWVNVGGSFLIGLLYVVIVEKGLWSNQWRILLMTGFLGALTTFSTFSIETVALMQRGQLGLATGYVLSSVLGALGACYIAVWLSNRFF